MSVLNSGRMNRSRNSLAKISMIILLMSLVTVMLTGCGGGGGGGGSTGTGNTTVSGTVLLVETNLPPSPGAVVTIGGQQATTDATGAFTLTSVSSSATSGTVTATGEQPLTLALHLTSGQVNALGTIYVSSTGYTAIASGTVASSTNGVNKPISGATVTIGGQSTVTASDGTFTISNLPVGLGTDPTTHIGNIQATGYVNKPITVQFPLATGSNPLGTLLLGAPIASSTPGQPFTIYGFVTKGGNPFSTSVTLSPTVGPLVAQTNPVTGEYFFWVPAGTYTVQELSSGTSKTVTVTSTATPVEAPAIGL